MNEENPKLNEFLQKLNEVRNKAKQEKKEIVMPDISDRMPKTKVAKPITNLENKNA